MVWIKVEVQPIKMYGPTEHHIRLSLTYRIFCKQCGHDDYRKHWDDAMWRAQQMYWDHLPYSPGGTLSCYDWKVSGD